MTFRALFALGALSVACCALPAATINGSFSIDGSVNVSLTDIKWTDNSNVSDKYVVGPPNPSGSWQTMALNSEGNVQNLNINVEPVGTQFNFPDWMNFPGPGPQSTITITLQYLYPGVDGQAECNPNGAPAPGQTCTPLAGNNLPGPFNLQNSASGTTSSATFTFLGTAHDSSGTLADSQIIGQYSANFSTPYQTVLQNLKANGSVTNTYAATFTASPSVPEPSTAMFFGIGLGLFAVSAGFRRVRTSRS